MSESSSDPVIDDGHRRAVGAPPDVPALQTRLTQEYGLRHPFVGAGMGFIAHERLAPALTNSRGFGGVRASPPSPGRPGRLGEQIPGLNFGPFRRGPLLAATRFRPAT